jgi:hypothetical protein
VQDWLFFALGLLTCAVVQWTLLAFLPLSLTYYEGGRPYRRRLSLGSLIAHAARDGVELHGSLLYLDTGREKGTVGGNWAALALASLVVGPWVDKSELR